MNNYRRGFQIAIASNLLLAAGLLMVWARHRSAAEENKPAAAESSWRSTAAAQDKTEPPASPEAPLVPIQLTPQRMQSIGVKMGTAEFKDISDELHLTGTVEIDERKIADVHVRFPGFVKRVFVNSTYRYVRKNDALLSMYSPEVVSTEREYLLARQNRAALRESSIEGVAAGAASLVSAAEQRLRQWEVPPQEIARLMRTGQVSGEITVNSPVSGYVTERNALASMYVQPETKLYSISDLSTVWINAQVFQNDIGRLRAGARATVTVDGYPDKSFNGRIEQILPQVDMATRTTRVRVAIANPGRKLVPGMFVNVVLKSSMGSKLMIPASAVFNSGKRQLVFMDRGNGNLEPHDVEAGTPSGEDVVVLSGLKPGDRIVTSANFLIDSEAQLQAAAGAFAPPPPGAGAASVMNRPDTTPAAIIVFSSDPEPPRKGKNIFRVQLTAPGGDKVTGAEVSATFYMPAMSAMGMAAMRVVATLSDKGGGNYEGQGDLGSGGSWQVTIEARQKGQIIAQKKLTITATGGM